MADPCDELPAEDIEFEKIYWRVEAKLIIELTNRYGINKWLKISQELTTNRNRFHKANEWTKTDDCIISDAFSKLHNNENCLNILVRLLPHHDKGKMQNRWNVWLKKKHLQLRSKDPDVDLVNLLVNQEGWKKWAVISSELRNQMGSYIESLRNTGDPHNEYLSSAENMDKSCVCTKNSAIKTEPAAINDETQTNRSKFGNGNNTIFLQNIINDLVDSALSKNVVGDDKLTDIINEYTPPEETVVDESSSSTSSVFIPEQHTQFPMDTATVLKDMSTSGTTAIEIVSREKKLPYTSEKHIDDLFVAGDKILSPEIATSCKYIQNLMYSTQQHSIMRNFKSTTVCKNEDTENLDLPGCPITITDIVSLSKESNVYDEEDDYLYKESLNSSEKDVGKEVTCIDDELLTEQVKPAQIENNKIECITLDDEEQDPIDSAHQLVFSSKSNELSQNFGRTQAVKRKNISFDVDSSLLKQQKTGISFPVHGQGAISFTPKAAETEQSIPNVNNFHASQLPDLVLTLSFLSPVTTVQQHTTPSLCTYPKPFHATNSTNDIPLLIPENKNINSSVTTPKGVSTTYVEDTAWAKQFPVVNKKVESPYMSSHQEYILPHNINEPTYWSGIQKSSVVQQNTPNLEPSSVSSQDELTNKAIKLEPCDFNDVGNKIP